MLLAKVIRSIADRRTTLSKRRVTDFVCTLHLKSKPNTLPGPPKHEEKWPVRLFVKGFWAVVPTSLGLGNTSCSKRSA